MNVLNFETLRKAWSLFIQEREEEIRRLSQSFTSPSEIYLKRVRDTDEELVVEFLGFENAVDNVENIQQAKRIIQNWIKRFSMSVRLQPSNSSNVMILSISKELKFSEAAISVFKRDPKSNKTKKAYRCIGGKKNGRKVSNPDDCIGVPDFDKKINLKVSKRAKYGQSSASKTKTKLTNIVARRVKKANTRLKKARGF